MSRPPLEVAEGVRSWWSKAEESLASAQREFQPGSQVLHVLLVVVLAKVRHNELSHVTRATIRFCF
jgi:hypothetical protein